MANFYLLHVMPHVSFFYLTIKLDDAFFVFVWYNFSQTVVSRLLYSLGIETKLDLAAL
jgi:hypothetical protein